MLNISQLKKSFGQNHVLSDVNLSIEKGAMTAIVGPNGCGKSTLFNIITSDLACDGGKILLGDTDITDFIPEDIAKLGMLRKFQIPGVFPEMTVMQHLILPFIIQNRKIIENTIYKTAKEMHIFDLLHDKVKILSTGQKQWLELAMLVLLRPKVLLLDEPIAGMTTSEIDTTLALLKNLNDEGITILTIEHNMDFVRRLTDDIVVLINGNVRMRADFQTIAKDEFVQEHYLGSLYA